MTASIQFAIRWGAYPLVFGGCAAAMIWLLHAGIAQGLGSVGVVAIGLACVALMERVQPFHRDWWHDRGDTLTDILHSLVNLSVIQITASLVAPALADAVPASLRLFPRDAPLWLQLLIVALVFDFGLYVMHRASHHVAWLWRFHAAHHSAKRLYWLNGERRHPLHAAIMAGPGLLVLLASGVAPAVLATWLSILTVHLAFQHANIDYRLGGLRSLIGAAELHRWHHKREFEDAQVNFGEFLLIWDRLFGTFHAGRERVGVDAVGLLDRQFPLTYWQQLRYPFRSL